MASVRVQHVVSTNPVPSSGVRRSSRPVSGRLASSVSSVQPVRCPAVWCPAVWCPAVRCPPVWCPAVRCPPVRWSAGCCPPPSVRTRPSHPTSGGGVVDQVGAAGNLHHRNGRGPGGRHAVEWLGRRPSRPGRGRRCRGRALVSGGSVADPGRVGCGRRPRLTAGDQAGLAGVRNAVAHGCAVGTGAGCSARWPQRPRGCRSWAGVGSTTVGGSRGA
jgi:hypothetical protein